MLRVTVLKWIGEARILQNPFLQEAALQEAALQGMRPANNMEYSRFTRRIDLFRKCPFDILVLDFKQHNTFEMNPANVVIEDIIVNGTDLHPHAKMVIIEGDQFPRKR